LSSLLLLLLFKGKGLLQKISFDKECPYVDAVLKEIMCINLIAVMMGPEIQHLKSSWVEFPPRGPVLVLFTGKWSSFLITMLGEHH
jgi:hypothetical protein